MMSFIPVIALGVKSSDVLLSLIYLQMLVYYDFACVTFYQACQHIAIGHGHGMGGIGRCG